MNVVLLNGSATDMCDLVCGLQIIGKRIKNA